MNDLRLPGLTEVKAKVLLSTIRRLAAYHDTGASEYLAQTGSYAMFDEPSAVRLCRNILADLELLS